MVAGSSFLQKRAFAQLVMQESRSESQLLKIRREQFRLNSRKARKVDQILAEVKAKLQADWDPRPKSSNRKGNYL